tara:strand:- start:1269 stop:1394 length:126 start_codon:yes stop_codon:yes gene_type:complete
MFDCPLGTSLLVVKLDHNWPFVDMALSDAKMKCEINNSKIK